MGVRKWKRPSILFLARGSDRSIVRRRRMVGLRWGIGWEGRWRGCGRGERSGGIGGGGGVGGSVGGAG